MLLSSVLEKDVDGLSLKQTTLAGPGRSRPGWVVRGGGVLVFVAKKLSRILPGVVLVASGSGSAILTSGWIFQLRYYSIQGLWPSGMCASEL